MKDKPEDVKNRFAILVAISVTVIIVGIWLLVMKSGRTSDEVNKKSISDDLKPLMMIFGNAKEEAGKAK